MDDPLKGLFVNVRMFRRPGTYPAGGTVYYDHHPKNSYDKHESDLVELPAVRAAMVERIRTILNTRKAITLILKDFNELADALERGDG